MKRDITIIGAGIMGLTTAYELLKAGRKVTIIDESDITFYSYFFISHSSLLHFSSILSYLFLI